MRRTNQLSPMRSLILLAVTWVAGTLLFAAERAPTTPTVTPTIALTQTPAEPAQAGASEATPESVPGRAAGADTSTVTEEVDADVDETAETVAAQSDKEQAAEESKAGETPQRATAADTQGTKGSPQRFVPSEQVRADFDVSFPIDI